MEALGTANIIQVYAAGNAATSSPSVVSGAAIYDDDFKETTVITVSIGLRMVPLLVTQINVGCKSNMSCCTW